MVFIKIIKQLIIPKPPLLGRWNNKSSDTQKHIKFILANTDHCGDKICGKPLTTKQFFELKKDFYVLDIEDVLEKEVLELIDKVLKERAKGWYYSSNAFYAFQKPGDKDLVKSALSWDFIKNKLKLDSIEIKPYKEFVCDRSLDGFNFLNKTNYKFPSWEIMIDEMISFQKSIK